MCSRPPIRRRPSSILPLPTAVDHILVGARHGSLMRTLLGSVSAKIAAEAECTVTVVRPRSAGRSAQHKSRTTLTTAPVNAAQLVGCDGERRRQIDDVAERADEHALLDEARAQGVEVGDAFEFDHADRALARARP